MESRKWRGAVIVSDQRHSHGLIELLAAPVREQMNLNYYEHPYGIEIEENHDFVVVFSLEPLRGVIRFYDTRRCPVPLLVHVDSPDNLRGLQHDILFPGLRVLAIPQALFNDEPGVTLEINLFARVIELLRGPQDEPAVE